mgnify:CR=1 FL=1
MEIEAIYISPGHDFYNRFGIGRLNHDVNSPKSVQCVEGKGLVGDRFYDYKENFKGQATFFSSEVADRLRQEFPEAKFDNSAFRRNIIVSGLDLNSLIGKRFRVGGVDFEGTQESAPCAWMDEAVAPGAHEFLKGNGGLRVRILSSGKLKVGDSILQLLKAD